MIDMGWERGCLVTATQERLLELEGGQWKAGERLWGAG